MTEKGAQEVAIVNKENPRKQIFFEIGPGGNPIYNHVKLPENSVYIGIDLKRNRLAGSRHDEGREMGANFIVGDKFSKVIDGNEEQLSFPVKAGSIETVFMANVLGDHNTSVGTGEIRLLEEAGKILKPDGQLIIVETYTPRDRKELKEFLDEAGLMVTEIVDEKTPNWWERFSQYCDGDEIQMMGRKLGEKSDFPYILFAKKKVNENPL